MAKGPGLVWKIPGVGRFWSEWRAKGGELSLAEMGRLNRLDVLQGEFLESSKEETS